MSLWLAIFLGLVQGVTEFIPVSSSGHLVIANALVKNDDAFIFNTLLNFGTLAALLWFYRRRIWGIIVDIVSQRKFGLALKLVAATIPVVLVGVVLGDAISKLDDNLAVVISMLLIVGVVMVWMGRPNRHASDQALESVQTSTFGLVGLAQVLALIPGTSRSGITVLAGMRRNLSAARAAELSFLLAIPTILGASLKVLLSDAGRTYVSQNLSMVIIGNIVSAISGWLAIRYMLSLLARRGLTPFGWYRIALAAVLILLLSVKIL